MKFLIAVLSLLAFNIQAQDAPNFTITDTEGIEHDLYEDYLDEGKTVVIKFFFVGCPPCIAIAPSVQELYEEWGEGDYDVEFMELSILSSDSNDEIKLYKDAYELTFIGAGADGGALEAVEPFQNGDFGAFRGTPSFAVIAPDKSVVYNTGGVGTSGRIQALSDAIADTGATGKETTPVQLPSTFAMDIQDSFGNDITDISYTISSAADPSVSYPAVISSNILSIQDIAEEFPGISDPVLTLSKTDDIRARLTPLDILLIRKHILGVIRITDPALLMAADTDGNGIVNPLDMLTLQKVILGIFTEFPVESYQFVPNQIPLTLQPGQNQEIEIQAAKTGDLNGF